VRRVQIDTINSLDKLARPASKAQLWWLKHKNPSLYIQNKFGREGLILGGHCFRVKNRHNDRVYWRCSIPATVNKINKLKINYMCVQINTINSLDKLARPAASKAQLLWLKHKNPSLDAEYYVNY
jgi:hypothetical protein